MNQLTINVKTFICEEKAKNKTVQYYILKGQRKS